MWIRWLTSIAAMFSLMAPLSIHRSSSGTGAPAVGKPGEHLPVEKAHVYRMAGKIRPLLFWIGRDDVGMGRIVWRRGAGEARAYELLIGTDPLRAPRRLNRWGFITEETDGATGTLLAMMSRSEERSLDQVRAASAPGGEFAAMQARVEDGACVSSVPIVHADRDPTFREVDALVEQVRLASERAPVRTTRVPPGVRPGFLSAVAELVQAGTAGLRGGTLGVPPPVAYVYGTRLYDLALRSQERLAASADAVRQYGAVARGRFEIRSRATNELTRFELLYGLDGALAEVPVQITYQPRWWLKVELTLER